MPGKLLGAIGVVLTIGGFMLQLIEPTFLLAYQPPTYGHTAAVLAVAWSPDGRHIASASADATVQVWSIGQEGNVLTSRRHYTAVGTLAWSPDGKYIVSGSTDGTMLLWDATSGRTVSMGGTVTNHLTVAWSPFGNRIAAPGQGSMVVIWNTPLRDGTHVVVNLRANAFALGFQDHAASLTDLAWSPDGTSLAATSADGTLRIWKVGNTELDSSEVMLSPPVLGHCVP